MGLLHNLSTGFPRAQTMRIASPTSLDYLGLQRNGVGRQALVTSAGFPAFVVDAVGDTSNILKQVQWWAAWVLSCRAKTCMIDNITDH
eukprot:IDg6592t1